MSLCISPSMKYPFRSFCICLSFGRFFFLIGFLINMYKYIYSGFFTVLMFALFETCSYKVQDSQPQACNPCVSASQVFVITGKSHHTQLFTVSFIFKGFQYFYTTNSTNIFYFGVHILCFA